jgi:hypothetical protein
MTTHQAGHRASHKICYLCYRMRSELGPDESEAGNKPGNKAVTSSRAVTGSPSKTGEPKEQAGGRPGNKPSRCYRLVTGFVTGFRFGPDESQPKSVTRVTRRKEVRP